MARIDKSCPTHSGRENKLAREPMDKMMADLPKNQSGEGRHKCPYCAYQRGFYQGGLAAVGPLRRALKDVMGRLGVGELDGDEDGRE